MPNAIGPMRIEPAGISLLEPTGYCLYRGLKHGGSMFCGYFHDEPAAKTMALILSRVDDASFVAAIRQQLAEADAKIARSAA